MHDNTKPNSSQKCQGWLHADSGPATSLLSLRFSLLKADLYGRCWGERPCITHAPRLNRVKTRSFSRHAQEIQQLGMFGAWKRPSTFESGRAVHTNPVELVFIGAFKRKKNWSSTPSHLRTDFFSSLVSNSVAFLTIRSHQIQRSNAVCAHLTTFSGVCYFDLGSGLKEAPVVDWVTILILSDLMLLLRCSLLWFRRPCLCQSSFFWVGALDDLWLCVMCDLEYLLHLWVGVTLGSYPIVHMFMLIWQHRWSPSLGIFWIQGASGALSDCWIGRASGNINEVILFEAFPMTTTNIF